jgi:hypothetical protein
MVFDGYRVWNGRCGRPKLTPKSKANVASKARRHNKRVAQQAHKEEPSALIADPTNVGEVPSHNGRYASSIDF